MLDDVTRQQSNHVSFDMCARLLGTSRVSPVGLISQQMLAERNVSDDVELYTTTVRLYGCCCKIVCKEYIGYCAVKTNKGLN
jgi:glycerol-3-phosphate O-acyltransferase